MPLSHPGTLVVSLSLSLSNLSLIAVVNLPPALNNPQLGVWFNMVDTHVALNVSTGWT